MLNPDDSLLLQKPAMQVPHEGGRRFSPDSTEYQLQRNWIAAGMPTDSDQTPLLKQLIVTPPKTTLLAPQLSVDLKAMATFSDGSTKDVTHLAVLESSDPAVHISPAGLVEFESSEVSRQTSITVRYLNLQQTARVEFE